MAKRQKRFEVLADRPVNKDGIIKEWMEVGQAQGQAEGIVIDVSLRERDRRDVLRTIRDGLISTPRVISPQFFYDDHGSRLFERITELPAYYQTRTERALLRQIAPHIVVRTQVEELVVVEVVETRGKARLQWRTTLTSTVIYLLSQHSYRQILVRK